jgi:hypothetical protein
MSTIFQRLLHPVTGEQLRKLFYSTAYQTEVVNKERIAEGATAALEKIEKHYGTELSSDGNSLPELQKIRDRLFAVVNGSAEKIEPYTILAPHVHWHDVKPTIYIAGGHDEYIIGQHDIHSSKTYYPVTFIFSPFGPIPFEWAEQSIPIHEDELSEILETLVALNSSLQPLDCPFGIAIDFRFKKSLFDAAVGSLELPITDEEHPYRGFSRIVPRLAFQRKNGTIESEQVSWHARSDLIDGFTEQEINLLNYYRSEIRQLKTTAEKEAFIHQLEQRLL